ncbi:MAG: hydroxymethylbilane synthase [Chloroflexi bacterium]|nr:hydroxymethylbilane synthase [Ktedonobacteraceae bacterium]MBV8821558.1 hydroxymethylbilane synthase [Ktedonobacteraceae bacterium]MBV9021829.1 hydroxymethylbilane synthase [Ktedonobacteraceae bacterium]MBV9707380.1 hydroxymethylbilane synthase [Chloroflexota bacterium]
MTQTQWVIERLRQLHPDLELAIEPIRTKGDHITNVPLTQMGSDGVFVAEIERALHERRIDVAVHSLKDVPTLQPVGLRLIVVGPREDVRDVLVSPMRFAVSTQGLYPLSDNKQDTAPLRIGTCSLRRSAQIQHLCPDAQIVPLRGNVDTRLRKLEQGEYDGIMLACAGLHRLHMHEHLTDKLTYLPVEVMMPAPGQGALALEVRDEAEILSLLAHLNDVGVQATTNAERMFMRRLGAGCYLPVAAYAQIVDDLLSLRGLVISLDGQRRVSVQQHMHWTPATNIEHAEQLGVRLAEQALALGASDIIQGLAAREQEGQRV